MTKNVSDVISTTQGELEKLVTDLRGLLANKDRNAALAALQRADRHLLSLNTYATAIPRRRI